MSLPRLRDVTAVALVTALSAASVHAQDAAVEPPVTAQPSAPASVPAPEPPSIPVPAEVAWRELHLLQEQERELWLEHGEQPTIALPLTGVVLGVPMLAVLLPIGGILVADARDANCGSDGFNTHCFVDRSERRIGRALLAFGTIGAIMIGVGAWSISRIRHSRHASESKLESIGQRRTLLEHVIEAQVRGVSVSY